MALVAHVTSVEKFHSIQLELRIFVLYTVNFDYPPDKQVEYKGLFFAIFDMVSEKYSDTKLPSLAAARGWLSEIERLRLDATAADVAAEREVICEKLSTEKVLFAAQGTRGASPTEIQVIEEHLEAQKLSFSTGRVPGL